MKSTISVITLLDYPILNLRCLISDSQIKHEFGSHFPISENWGEWHSDNECTMVMDRFVIAIAWTPLYKKRIFTFESIINIGHEKETQILVGLTPNGEVCIWDFSTNKSKIALFEKCMEDKEIKNDSWYSESHYQIYYEDVKKKIMSLPLYNKRNKDSFIPPHDLFDNYMKQFTYRYQVFFEHWDEDEEKWIKYDEKKDNVIPEFEYIEESLFDGTHDKLHDGGLMKYHEAGKPKKLALKWHIKKSDYSAYFWFEEDDICAIFNKFYGQHPDTKTDFIIHIDPIKKKNELLLYRYGLKQPVIIPESAYQLIVFKSGFENYRSDNYNQPTGAWIW